MGDSYRGLWMEIESWIARKEGWGVGGLLRCLIDVNKMKWEKKGVVGQEEMTEVN